MGHRFLFFAAFALAVAASPAAAFASTRGCADQLRASLVENSFAPLGRPAEVAHLGVMLGRQFRRLADAMCVSGRLPAARMRRMHRLIATYDPSIMIVTLAPGRAQENERDAIIYFFAFHQMDDRAGAPVPPGGIWPFRLPGDRELREALTCWAMGSHMTEDCRERGN